MDIAAYARVSFIPCEASASMFGVLMFFPP